MDDDDQKLSAELKMKLLEVEINAEEESRFDFRKGLYMGLLSLGFFFTFGIAFRGGLLKSLIFGIFGGIVGFFSGSVKRPKKK